MNSDDEREELRSADPAIWESGTTLSPEQTKDTKVHLTLRLDADLYRQLLRYKKHHKQRTITSAVEAILHKGLGETTDSEHREHLVEAAIAHDLYQDQLLAVLARNVHLKSERDRTIVEQFLQQSDAFGRALNRST